MSSNFLKYKENGTWKNSSAGFDSKYPLTIKMKSSNNNIYIYNSTDLINAMANYMGKSEIKNYYLMNNIDLTELTSINEVTSFYGYFYGNGFRISLPTSSEVGTGGLICPYLIENNYGKIQDLIIDGGQVVVKSAKQSFGGICGHNYGKIIGCFNKRDMYYTGTSTAYVGGICGENEGEIIKCVNNACVGMTTTQGSMNIAGIAGRNSGLIQSCGVNSGSLIISGNISGGIVGYSLAGSIVDNCYFNGYFDGGTYIGGIVGYSYKGIISNCYSAVSDDGLDLEYKSQYNGGICGFNNYGTYLNNYYDNEHFSKASSEYDSSTSVNSTGLSLFEMREGWQYDMLTPLEERLGNRFVHISGYNNDFPVQTWQRSSMIIENEYPGVTTSIWIDYIDEMSNAITVNFENTNYDGKLKKLEIEISRRGCNNNQIEVVHKKTIINPSTFESWHFENSGDMLLDDPSQDMSDGYYLAHIEAKWTTINNETRINTLDVFPYNLHKAIIFSSQEALNYLKNNFGLNNCSIDQESSYVMSVYLYPLEYMFSYTAGSHREYMILSCTGQAWYSGEDIAELYTDTISLRCFPAEITKRQKGYVYGYNLNDYPISRTGTIDLSGRKFTVLNNAATVMSDGTYFYGPITNSSGGGGAVACLLEGSEILNFSNKLVPIETLKIGDKVKSYNEKTKEIEDKEIYKIYNHKPICLYKITLNNGTEIFATNTHRFATKEKGVVNVMNIEIGNTLITEDNKIELKIEKTKIIPIDKPVYEIWVKDNNNYYIGKDKILSYCEDINDLEDLN